MQLGIDSQIPDGLLAANALLAENSRLGVPTSTHTLHRGFEFAISSTYKGFQFRCSESASDPAVTSNNGTPQKPTGVPSQCEAEATAASNKQPSVTPSGQNLFDGVMGGLIGVAILAPGLPEDAPLLPVLVKAGQGVVTGILRRSVVHLLQQGIIGNATYATCMAAAGQPVSPTFGMTF